MERIKTLVEKTDFDGNIALQINSVNIFLALVNHFYKEDYHEPVCEANELLRKIIENENKTVYLNKCKKIITFSDGSERECGTEFFDYIKTDKCIYCEEDDE